MCTTTGITAWVAGKIGNADGITAGFICLAVICTLLRILAARTGTVSAQRYAVRGARARRASSTRRGFPVGKICHGRDKASSLGFCCQVILDVIDFLFASTVEIVMARLKISLVSDAPDKFH